MGKAVVPLGRGMMQYGLAGLLEFWGTVEAPELQRSCCGRGKGDTKGTGCRSPGCAHPQGAGGALNTAFVPRHYQLLCEPSLGTSFPPGVRVWPSTVSVTAIPEGFWAAAGLCFPGEPRNREVPQAPFLVMLLLKECGITSRATVSAVRAVQGQASLCFPGLSFPPGPGWPPAGP